MRIDRPSRWLIVGALLLAGLLLSYARSSLGTTEEASLGAMLWHGRGLDLAVQLGLLLVGALAIRAMLPGEDEHVGDDDDPMA